MTYREELALYKSEAKRACKERGAGMIVLVAIGLAVAVEKLLTA